ncbi:MAG: tRNA-dihydrouridine synthase family protein [Lentisphaerae bacterium]|jgi:tRNA-dihydrouridine synthase|nr:tRNA-dihydrouridine synthase family protein [Lentisphaerota bacterium]
MFRSPEILLDPLELVPGQTLPCRILPGPMDGVTEQSFLTAMSIRNWVPCWWTPFLRISTGVPRQSRLVAWLKPYLDTGLPVIAQIMGVSSEKLAETARRLHEAGALCVDLNCACPSPQVVSNQGGGACLKNPSWICKTLLDMRERCGNRAISVKIRAGFASASELPDIAAALREARPNLVSLHYRTVTEMYQPIPDGLQRLRQAREALPDIPLFGSGDLFTADDALQMFHETGVDGLLPARGLLANPALLQQIQAACRALPLPEPSHSEKLAFLRDLARPGRENQHAPNGFLLRMCATLFGRNSELFQKLVHLHKLQASWEYLDRVQKGF